MTERSIAMSERARALDPNNALSAATFAITRAERGELAQGYREANAVVRRYPDNARAQFALSYVLRYAGLLEEAASHCETALLLDAQTGVRSCAVVFILRGNYRRAMDYIRVDRDSEWVKALSIDALLREGNTREALALAPDHAPVWAGFDVLLAHLRHRPAEEIGALARTVQPIDDPEENYFAAAHLAYSGQTSSASRCCSELSTGTTARIPRSTTTRFYPACARHPGFPRFAPRRWRARIGSCRREIVGSRRRVVYNGT